MSIEDSLPQDLREDVRKAAEILVGEGCREVYLFGSVATGTFGSDSDIDLATVGLSKDKFFTAYGKVMAAVGRVVDLVALDYDQDFGRRLKEVGPLTRVA
jgi:predicted nucleotidyltransferase